MTLSARELHTQAISHRANLGEEDLLDWTGRVVSAGVDCVQLREKDLDDRALYALARQLRTLIPKRTLFLVNGRCDVALAAGADGVHLTSTSPPSRDVRRAWPDLVIGRSIHAPEEIAAEEGFVDYVSLAPIFAPRSKVPHRPVAGLELLRRACRSPVPVLALGGVEVDNLSEIAAAGAAGVAAISAFQAADGGARLIAEARRHFSPGPHHGGPP